MSHQVRTYTLFQKFSIGSMGLALWLAPVFSISQDSDTLKNKRPVSEYIENMDKYLAFKLDISDDIERFEARGDGYFYDIRPNSNMSMNLGLNFRFLSISMGITPNFLPGNGDDDRRGKSSTFSFGTHASFKRWFQYLSAARTKGYYLHNSDDYMPDWDPDTSKYIQFPDLVNLEFRGYTGFRVNPRFSLKSTRSQSERQLKSAGSLMPILVYRYYIFDNRAELTGQNSTQKSNNFEMLATIGYYYNFVIREVFYISAGVTPGAGFIQTRLLTRTPEGDYISRYTNPVLRAEVHAALGYNSERFFAGGQVVASWAGYDQDGQSNVVMDNRITYQVFAGYRFGAPRFLDRAFDWGENLYLEVIGKKGP